MNDYSDSKFSDLVTDSHYSFYNLTQIALSLYHYNSLFTSHNFNAYLRYVEKYEVVTRMLKMILQRQCCG
jgi:hypothetical protein